MDHFMEIFNYQSWLNNIYLVKFVLNLKDKKMNSFQIFYETCGLIAKQNFKLIILVNLSCIVFYLKTLLHLINLREKNKVIKTIKFCLKIFLVSSFIILMFSFYCFLSFKININDFHNFFFKEVQIFLFLIFLLFFFIAFFKNLSVLKNCCYSSKTHCVSFFIVAFFFYILSLFVGQI